MIRHPLIFVQYPIYASYGLFAPAVYLILAERGAAQFGALLAITSLGSMMTSYLAGRLIKRHNILAYTCLAQAAIMPMYLVADASSGVYVLQIIFGILIAVVAIHQDNTMARLSPQSEFIGTHNALLQAITALATVLGGLCAAYLGIPVAVFIAAGLMGFCGVVAAINNPLK